MEDNKNNITQKIYYITRKNEEENFNVGMHEGNIKQIDYENHIVWYNDGSFTHFEKIREEYSYLDLTDMHIYRDSARHAREKAEDERENKRF